MTGGFSPATAWRLARLAAASDLDLVSPGERFEHVRRDHRCGSLAQKSSRLVDCGLSLGDMAKNLLFGRYWIIGS